MSEFNVFPIKPQVIGPTLLATLPYGDFPASTLGNFSYSGVLHRNAIARTFAVSNTMDQGLTTCQVRIYDSQWQEGVNQLVYTDIQLPSAGSVASVNGDLNNSVGASADSVKFYLSVGATAPTTGNVYLYVTEVF